MQSQLGKTSIWSWLAPGSFWRKLTARCRASSRNNPRILVRSEIHIIKHGFLVDNSLAARSEEVTAILTAMTETEKGRRIVQETGVKRWEAVETEGVELMIYLMSGLVS
ncbi:MAG: hypothetical protein WA632_04485 [Gallionella sp.]